MSDVSLLPRYCGRRGYYQRPNVQWSQGGNRRRRAELYIAANFTCQSCGYRPADDEIPANYDGKRTIGTLVIDHIVPLCRGGDVRGDNLQVLCASCNGGKR